MHAPSITISHDVSVLPPGPRVITVRISCVGLMRPWSNRGTAPPQSPRKGPGFTLGHAAV
eukprot:scaffold21044_cov124-Isochrysis_galbana.AAC.5